MRGTAKRAADCELALRIVIVDPPPGVRFCLQRGRGELVAPTTETRAEITLSLLVDARITPDGLTVHGPFAQGPPAARFVYVNSGTLAGQADSCWTRRAKIPLAGIRREAVEQVVTSPDLLLEVRIPGTAADGGPVCASVPISLGGWAVKRVPRNVI